MIDPLQASLKIAGSGLEVQSARLRVVSENLANAESTGATPGSNPYVRKTITFASEMDRAAGVDLVQVKKIGLDPTPFHIEHNPGHPAADQNGDVKLPNVNIITEMSDMREANRSYEANLQIVKQARDLISMTIGLFGTSP
jgi:flagellar basal-body rod protein FlgC